MPSSPTPWRRLTITLAAAGAALIAIAAGVAAPATAGPFDPVSLAITGGTPDFGALKTGTTLTRTITLTNDATDSLRVDPAPLSALAAPFTLVSTTLKLGELIDPGQSRTVQVSYTAPAAGTMSNQTVTLTMVNATGTATAPFLLKFSGRSLATDRGSFTLTNPSGGQTAAFGQVKLGTPATLRMKIEVAGIDPLRFTKGDITVRDDKGVAFAPITISASTFDAGVTLDPATANKTATFDLRFAPTKAGTVVGDVTVVGRVMSGDPEAKNVTVTVPFTAEVVPAVVPTPTPTPTPTGTPDPTSTATPTPTSTAPAPGSGGGTDAGAGSNGQGPAAGSGTSAGSRGSGTLASTGVDALPAVGFVGLALLGGVIAVAFTRRSARQRG